MAERRRRKEELETTVNQLEAQRQKLLEQITQLQYEITGLGTLEEIAYERYIPIMTSNELEVKIFEYERRLGALVEQNMAVIPTRQYRIDGSEAKGQKFQENYGKNLLIGFNTYVQTKEKTINESNCYRVLELIDEAFSRFNKQGNLLGITINSKYKELRCEIIKYKLQLKILKAQEREQLREEKRRLKEQEKLLEEAERTKRELAKERKHYTQLLGRAIDEVEQEQIKAKLSEIDKREADVDYRLENAKAGWLYVISSTALQGMVKIGATKRLNPFIRIRELSSASIPYPFVCHGLVFSDDVFALENSIHQHFDEQRVNKTNGHKEFFEITPKEAIDILTNKFNCKVQFAQEDEFGGSEE